jgi:hypothetical protein
MVSGATYTWLEERTSFQMTYICRLLKVTGGSINGFSMTLHLLSGSLGVYSRQFHGDT